MAHMAHDVPQNKQFTAICCISYVWCMFCV